MLAHLQSKYQLIFTMCLALAFSLFCANVDARKRDGSDENNSSEENKFVCPTYFGDYPDPEDCESYYECDCGEPERRRCPAWRKFDKYERCCVPHYMAQCEEGTTKATTVKEEETTSIKDGKFICPSMSGFYPHPEDCSKYYKCSFFFSSLRTCPENQLFDEVRKECKPASEVNCSSRKRPTTTPPSTEPTTLSSITTPSPTTTPNPTTIPNPTTTSESTTVTEPTTATERITPKQTGPPEIDCKENDIDCIIKKIFVCPQDIGSYRHPSNKKLFIFCINKKPFVKRCGRDLIFSDELKTCVRA